MKKLTYTLAIICLSAVVANAEYISSVYYNPVPHGKYERLTISDNLNVASDLQSTGVMQIGSSLASITQKFNGNKRMKSLPEEKTQIMSPYGYGIDATNVTGQVSFPRTTFNITEVSGQSGSGRFNNYAGENGDVTFSRSSQVLKLADTTYGIVSRSLNNASAMTVTGSSGTFVDGRSTQKGLVLANYEIEQPTVCTSNPRWVSRKDSSNVWHQVLGCAGTEEQLDCSQAAVRANNKPYCCAMAAYSRTPECGYLAWEYNINDCKGGICYGTNCGSEMDTCGGGGRSGGACPPELEGASCYVREVEFDDPDRPDTSMGAVFECWPECRWNKSW